MASEDGSSSGSNSTGGNEYNSTNNSRMTITALIVDDDPYDRRSAFIEILHTYGYQTYAVNDGRQAIDLCYSGINFDVIFLEMKPSMNSLQTARDLRAIGVCSMIVGMEVFTLRNDFIEFRESGLDIFFEKPVCRLSVGLLYNEIEKKKRAAEDDDP